MTSIYFLYGADTYRSWQKLQAIKAKYRNASMGDTDLATLDGAELTLDQFIREGRAVPFLASRRLLIIRNLLLEGSKETAEAVMGALDQLPASTVAIFYESGSPDSRGRLFKQLNRPGRAQSFSPLEDGPLIKQICQMAEEEGLDLRPAMAQQLAALTGPDLWRISQELAKLAAYLNSQSRSGQSPLVTAALIEQLVSDQRQSRLFDLADALGLRQGEKATRLMAKLSREESALGVLAMIAGHYRNLLQIADARARQRPREEIRRDLALHPFVFDKSWRQSESYSYPELVELYRYLFRLDQLAKQSIVEPLTGLAVLAGLVGRRPLDLPSLTIEE